MPRLTCSRLLAAFAYVGCSGGPRVPTGTTSKRPWTAFTLPSPTRTSKKACNSISEKGQQEISEAATQGGKKPGCEQVFDVVLAFAGDQFAQAKDVKVTDVKLDGDQATAAIRVNDRDSQVTLLKEDGRWKLRGLSQSGS